MTKTKQRRPPGRRYSRTAARSSWTDEIPLLPVIVGALLLIGAVVLIIVFNSTKSTAAGAPIDNIQCQSGEQLAVHYHAHLTILVDGNETLLPALIGIDNTDQCLYWTHTHDTTGVIHIEAPRNFATHKFLLGEFFDVWGKKLDSTHVGDTTLSSGQKLVMFVDGKQYTGDPRKIVLGAHTQVVLEVTPPEVNPPPTYTFPAGL